MHIGEDNIRNNNLFIDIHNNKNNKTINQGFKFVMQKILRLACPGQAISRKKLPLPVLIIRTRIMVMMIVAMILIVHTQIKKKR